MPIKVGVIGCGVWGRNHARIYHDLKETELVGVVDLNQSSAKEIGERYNVPFHVDPNKILMDPEVELVSICTPTVTHAELGLKALKCGKHVLVEKPMANSVEEAKALVATAKKQKQWLTIGFVERFNPAVEEAYKRVSDGEIGEVILARCSRVSRSPIRIGDVGVVKDLAIHDIDIINNLMGELPEAVMAVTGKIRHKYEDYANINMLYKDNRNAFIETNWLTPRRVRTLTITGTEGIINVDYTNQGISIENDKIAYQPYVLYREPLFEELKSLAQHVMEDKEPEITGLDGLNALRVCEAALKSSETNRRVHIG